MGFRRPEVQILSPRPRRSRGCIACSDFFCKSHRALTPLRFPFPVARRKKPPCPAAQGRRPDCSVFSPFPLEKPLGKKGAAGMSARVPFKKKGLKTGGSRRAGEQAGIRSRFPLIPSQEKELKTGGSRGRARARAGGETGGRAGGGGAGGGAQGMQKSRAEKAARLLCRMESRGRCRIQKSAPVTGGRTRAGGRRAGGAGGRTRSGRDKREGAGGPGRRRASAPVSL